ncbi:hypothetical protein ATY89_06365 [Sulfolobus acidocaldarius]|uniref:Conserved protein n=4 Tax=Sulfolobus acidocaldarius TaxID=2285 RepID=Q4J6F0_SULAC|nr:conserved protein [Sulfolobus acidocaldarius DSM 639]AGE74551.1 hypothetical protein SacRon12I_11695 [Sulfolobus acidocaldarius Ron12/I]ALU30596.1 hypothetical protein ATY89_06365 [Sulfolobus acidocaldarius]ALU32857.1 hypothetical protein ATZ20_09390 [Sulfolobus acidocaldarius]WCM35964.1 hypothetical protein GO597_00900 [Sulfolobus acidocaldarius DSM 639]
MINDAKFYDKLIAFFFETENCTNCEDLYNKILKLTISQKYYFLRANANEYLFYTVRFSRGVVPSIGIINTSGELIGIIESENIDYIQAKLREIYDNRNKIKGFKIDKITTTREINTADFYEVVNYALDGGQLDFRGAQFLRFYAKIHKEYEKVLERALPLDPFAEYVLTGKKPDVEHYYTSTLAISTILGLFNDDVISKLLERINSDGSVYRSIRKEVNGLLIDQALVGQALLRVYKKTWDQKYLDLAMKVYTYIKDNLKGDLGFRDIKPLDEVTKEEFYEPISNSETAIFLSQLWSVNNDETYLLEAKKAMEASYTIGGNDIRVIPRVAIAYLKINELIKSREEIKDDIRVEVMKEISCEDKDAVVYKGKCVKIDEVQSEL